MLFAAVIINEGYINCLTALAGKESRSEEILVALYRKLDRGINAFRLIYSFIDLLAVPRNNLCSVMYAQFGYIVRLIVEHSIPVFNEYGDNRSVIKLHHGKTVIVSCKAVHDIFIDIVSKGGIYMVIVKSVSHLGDHSRIS